MAPKHHALMGDNVVLDKVTLNVSAEWISLPFWEHGRVRVIKYKSDEFTVTAASSAREIKQTFVDRFIKHVKLMYNGQELSDEDSLSKYGIFNSKDIVHQLQIQLP